MTTELQLNLTHAEVNSIVARLAKFPAEEVYGLLRKIEDQAAPQLAKLGEAESVAPKPVSGSISRPTSGRLAK